MQPPCQLNEFEQVCWNSLPGFCAVVLGRTDTGEFELVHVSDAGPLDDTAHAAYRARGLRYLAVIGFNMETQQAHCRAVDVDALSVVGKAAIAFSKHMARRLRPDIQPDEAERRLERMFALERT